MKNFFKKSIISALLAITIFYAAAPALSSISAGGFSGFTGTVYAETYAELYAETEDEYEYNPFDTSASYTDLKDEEDEPKVDNKDNVVAKSPCAGSFGLGIFTGDCARWVIAQIIYNLVFRTTNYITYLTGTIFDTAIGFSINGDIYKVAKVGETGGNAMIGEGWELLRDFANIFFIFIILYIAISVILQVGTYGGKELLVKVIVTAMLVNFSLMITQTIVDASHVFAWNFYSKLNSEKFLKGDAIEGDDARFAQGIPRDMKVSDKYDAIGMSDIFMRAFNPQRLFTSSENSVSGELDSNFETMVGAKEGSEPSKSFLDSLWQIIMILILSSVLNLIVAFIFIAVAAMFIIRVVVLWMVMMAAPIAFLSMVLPGMKKISNMWWSALIGQSLFAPIFLFLFYLVAELISNDFVQKLVTEADNAPAAKVGFVNLSSTIVVFFHFAIFGALLIGILYIAKSLSVAGAGTMMDAGKKTSNWARNKFGDKAAMRFTGRHTVGRASNAIATSERMQRLTARMPIIGGAVMGFFNKGAGVGGFDKMIEERVSVGKMLKTPELRGKYFDNIDDRSKLDWYTKASARERVELQDNSKRLATPRRINAFNAKLSAEEIEKTLKARGEVDLKKSDLALANVFFSRSEEIQKEIINQMKDDRKTGFINELYSGYGTTPEFAAAVASAASPAGKNIRKFRPDLAVGRANIINAVGTHKPGDIQYLDKNIVDPTNINSLHVTEGMIKKYNGGHAQKVYERGDEVYTAFANKLKSLDPIHLSAATIAGVLRGMGNSSLASWLLTNKNAQNLFGLNP